MQKPYRQRSCLLFSLLSFTIQALPLPLFLSTSRRRAMPLITRNVWKNKKSSGGQKTRVKRICRVCMMCRMSLHYKEPFRFTPPCYFRNAIKFLWAHVLFCSPCRTTSHSQASERGVKGKGDGDDMYNCRLPFPFPSPPCHFVLSCGCAVTLFRSTVWLNDPKHFNIVFDGSLAASSSRPSNGLPCHAMPCHAALSAKDVFRSAQISILLVMRGTV